MASDTRLGHAITCAENIAALCLLHSVPEQPSRNAINDTHNRPQSYTLPLEKELRLADTLAFLAYAKDEPDRIPAICLQEDVQHACLNVLLAVNKESPMSGMGILQALKKNFEALFALLTQAHDDLADIENKIFSAIVNMCSERILGRLRLVRRKNKNGKMTIKECLKKALEHFDPLGQSSVRRDEFSTCGSQLIENAKRVIKLVDSWANYQTRCQVEELVNGVYRLRGVADLRTLIEGIPNNILEPCGRKHLYNMITKVARYREAARSLYRIAKKVPLARKLAIVLVNLPERAFKRTTLPNGYKFKLSTRLLQTQGTKRNDKDLEHICRLLNTHQDNAAQTLTDKTRRTLKDGKIHAEIQVLYFYELQALSRSSTSQHLLPPRTLCSSKDTCWLCNQFILLHGKIYTPKTHGRLYPGWRLPSLDESLFDDLARTFNERLQKRVQDSLNILLLRSKRTVYPDPNESTLLTLPWSKSTLDSVAPSMAGDELRQGNSVADESVGHAEEQASPDKRDERLPATLLSSAGSVSSTSSLIGPSLQSQAVTGSKEPKSADEQVSMDKRNEHLLAKPSSSARSILSISSFVGPSPRSEAVTGSEESKSEVNLVSVNGTNGSGGEINPSQFGNTTNIDQNNPAAQITLSSDISVTRTHSTSNQGEVKIESIMKGTMSRPHLFGPLSIQVEYANSSNSDGQEDNSLKALSYTMERITSDEMQRHHEKWKTPVIDATALGGEVASKTDKEGCMYLLAEGMIVKLMMQPI